MKALPTVLAALLALLPAAGGADRRARPGNALEVTH